MFDGDLLLPFASVTVERLEKRGIGAGKADASAASRLEQGGAERYSRCVTRTQTGLDSIASKARSVELQVIERPTSYVATILSDIVWSYLI
jgi:hypothetical protein